MVLTEREQLVAIITNGIAAYSLYSERGEMPESTTMFDFILRAMPEDLKSKVNMEIIDEVFDYVSKTHS